ncbi:hypothetical protein BMS3Abin07_02347 [bacterium BMS3Abin07]|nr:hypothetical protein BMS3Abin07_02347 [bacterium BMS3Abin07]GBE31312.1 hypothetical protein BMS3Bbin05_00212 [bacterium BMS3Bbin05]HDO22143.1 hypothetical protein [Nitrospirota bacterium]HDZ88287.1 hypothetical protein [Nitrospirota bacterium]
MMKSKTIYAIVSVFILLLISASGVANAEDMGVKEVVRAYNKALIQAYNTLRFDSLRRVVTEKEYNKVTIYIKSYAGMKQKLRAGLTDLVIKDVEKGSRKASVSTSEKWWYERVDMKTGSILVPKSIYNYEMRYDLVKDEMGKWRVDKLKILREERQ